MNYSKNLIRYSVFVICFLLFAICSSSVYAAASDSAAIDPETIKENIKRRIEQVVKSQATETKKRIAYIGVFSSVTKNSFSLEIGDGSMKQASTSATTVVVELGSNREINFDDISIGDHLAVLGFLNQDNQVMDARRILVLDQKPTETTKQSIYGITTKIDLKKNTLIVKDSKTNQDIMFRFNSSTLMQLTQDSSRKSKVASSAIPENNQILVIYEPKKSDKDVNLITSLLVRGAALIPTPSGTPKL